MKRILGLGTVLVLTALVSTVATACGEASSSVSSGASATAAPTETSTPTATTPPGETPTSTSTPELTATASLDDIVAQGRELYEKTAGGTGCAICHGIDAKGNLTIGAPDNRGADEQLIWDALGRVQNMAYIRLSNDEVKALSAYLKFLATQP